MLSTYVYGAMFGLHYTFGNFGQWNNQNHSSKWKVIRQMHSNKLNMSQKVWHFINNNISSKYKNMYKINLTNDDYFLNKVTNVCNHFGHSFDDLSTHCTIQCTFFCRNFLSLCYLFTYIHMIMSLECRVTWHHFRQISRDLHPPRLMFGLNIINTFRGPSSLLYAIGSK